MMLCKADFEDIFPNLFGPEKQKGQTGEPVWHGFFACAELHPVSAAEEAVIADRGADLEPESRPRSETQATS
ncbi:MAG: hypothetical protein Q8K20_06630 [Gemmobacter sp.]|jgi:hypothetical protein|nr:hypothetical protein [Gemmobacter sp.]